MGALTNALRRFLGGGDEAHSGGLVLAAQHYARVNRTWNGLEARGHGAATAPARRPRTHEEAAAERPDLALWDLPPGLQSVVDAESHREPPRAAPDERTRAIRQRRPEAPAAEARSAAEPTKARAINSQEMEALLDRLAD